jgi:hypothetical protein
MNSTQFALAESKAKLDRTIDRKLGIGGRIDGRIDLVLHLCA